MKAIEPLSSATLPRPFPGTPDRTPLVSIPLLNPLVCTRAQEQTPSLVIYIKEKIVLSQGICIETLPHYRILLRQMRIGGWDIL